MHVNSVCKTGIGTTVALVLALAAALLAGVTVNYWRSAILPLALVFALLLGAAFQRWGVHFVSWSLFCLSVPWTMVRVTVLGGAFSVSPAMALALTGGITWVMRARLERLPPLRIWRPGVLTASLFVGFSFISILWAPADSVRPALLNVGRYLFGLFVYVLLSSVVRDRHKLEAAVRLGLLSCGTMLVGILYYYLIYLGRGYVGVWVRGDVGERGKNTLAYVMSLFFPLMLAHLLLARSQKKVKLVEWAFAGVYALGLLFSTSRGTYVAAAFTLVFLLVYLVGRPRRRLVFIVGLAVLLLTLYQPTRVVDHLRSLGDILSLGVAEVGRSDYSVATRLRLIGAAWDSFRRSPLLGAGLGSFATLFSRPSHNDYLRVMAETGMIGLVAFMSFLLVHIVGLAKVLWIQRRSPRWLEVGLFGAILSMVIRLLVFNGDTFYVTWVVLGLVSALLLSQRARPSTDQED